jgi:hypothetical protein
MQNSIDIVNGKNTLFLIPEFRTKRWVVYYSTRNLVSPKNQSMKILLTSLLLLALIWPADAQESNTSYKVVSVISKETFTLNSGGRAMLGGRSRIDLPVELPANTVEWYYAVTTCPEKAPAPTIGLADQLIKYLTPTGIASSVLSAIMTPTGSNESSP